MNSILILAFAGLACSLYGFFDSIAKGDSLMIFLAFLLSMTFIFEIAREWSNKKGKRKNEIK